MSKNLIKQEHELSAYQRVQHRLERLDSYGDKAGMPIKTRGPLISALERLSCIPFVSFPTRPPTNRRIFVCGQDAGTLINPTVDVILEHSKPSPFGRGEKTVMDETYRCGREIPAADVTFTDDGHNVFVYELVEKINATLFVPTSATIKLYKIAIYREGGHFDWHRDSTHSERHHATLLVALNTTWTGGDLLLRRDGVETRIKMNPQPIKLDQGPLLRPGRFSFEGCGVLHRHRTQGRASH